MVGCSSASSKVRYDHATCLTNEIRAEILRASVQFPVFSPAKVTVKAQVQQFGALSDYDEQRPATNLQWTYNISKKTILSEAAEIFRGWYYS